MENDKLQTLVCRLCLDFILDVNATSLINISNEILGIVLQEIDLKLTENPTICESCLKSLQDSYNFKKQCIEVEQKIVNYREASYLNQVDLHDIVESKSNIFYNKTRNKTTDYIKIEIDLDEHNLLDNNCQNVIIQEQNDCKMENDLSSNSTVNSTRQLNSNKNCNDNYLSIEDVVLNWFPEHEKETAKNSIQFDNDISADTVHKNEETTNKFMKIIREEYLDSNKELLQKCINCNYQTPDKLKLRKHMYRDHSYSHACNFCEKKFKQKIHLDSHLLNKHNNVADIEKHVRSKIHYCHYCKYKTINNFNWSRHMFVKHKSKSKTFKMFQCFHCAYRTANRGNLISHLRTHNRVMPFLCVSCGKGFSQKVNLSVHILNHHSEQNKGISISNKIHSCDLCDFQTLAKWRYEKHMKSHSKIPTENVFSSACFQTYSNKIELENHELLDCHPADGVKLEIS